MIRRIALTLGAGVAVLTASANDVPTSEAGRLMSLSTEAGKHATMHVAAGKEEPSRSGYIVASS
jgi:outer membrane usher protein FimD/PapC